VPPRPGRRGCGAAFCPDTVPTADAIPTAVVVIIFRREIFMSALLEQRIGESQCLEEAKTMPVPMCLPAPCGRSRCAIRHRCDHAIARFLKLAERWRAPMVSTHLARLAT
jgi:hypothetical protein